jgi:hypothetical protein
MKMVAATDNIIGRSKQALERCLREVPFCRTEFSRIVSRSADIGIDLFGRFILPKGRVPFAVVAKSIGQPRFVREAVYSLTRYAASEPGAYPIFAAPFIADDAAKILEEEGIGYVDLSGNCRLCFDEVYVRCSGNENRFIRRRDLRSLYSPKSERLLRVLLGEPVRSWKVQELADEARVSLGQVSNVIRKLQDREWAARDESGMRLSKPDRLLSDWKANYDFARSERRDFFTLAGVDEFERRLATRMARAGGDYGLAAFSAAARFAPAVRYQRVYAYISGEIEQVADELGLKPVESGANVTLIEPYDDGVFIGAVEKDGVRVTSAIQSYLDLSQLRGRGEEAAQMLLREAIEPAWR